MFILLEIEKGLQHNTWRRRITSLKLNFQLSHTAAPDSRVAALGSPSLSLFGLSHSALSAQFALSRMPLFIGMNGATVSAFLQ
jgi:hypothetical protein